MGKLTQLAKTGRIMYTVNDDNTALNTCLLVYVTH